MARFLDLYHVQAVELRSLLERNRSIALARHLHPRAWPPSSRMLYQAPQSIGLGGFSCSRVNADHGFGDDLIRRIG